MAAYEGSTQFKAPRVLCMMIEDGSNQGFTLGDFRVIPGRGRSQKARRFDQTKMDIALNNAFEYLGDHDESTPTTTLDNNKQ